MIHTFTLSPQTVLLCSDKAVSNEENVEWISFYYLYKDHACMNMRTCNTSPNIACEVGKLNDTAKKKSDTD